VTVPATLPRNTDRDEYVASAGPVSLSPSLGSTARSLVTVWPGRSTRGNGPASITMLSPPVVMTRTGMPLGLLASFSVQPLPSAVASSADVVTTLSLGPAIVLVSQALHFIAAPFGSAGFCAWAATADAERMRAERQRARPIMNSFGEK